MSRKARAPSPWRQERLDHVRRALTAPVRPPRDERVEAEAARTERRQAARFGPVAHRVAIDAAPAEFSKPADIEAVTAKTRTG